MYAACPPTPSSFTLCAINVSALLKPQQLYHRLAGPTLSVAPLAVLPAWQPGSAVRQCWQVRAGPALLAGAQLCTMPRTVILQCLSVTLSLKVPSRQCGSQPDPPWWHCHTWQVSAEDAADLLDGAAMRRVLHTSFALNQAFMPFHCIWE